MDFIPQTNNSMEGELERQQQLNEGLQSDLARYNEREALLTQARSHPVQIRTTPSLDAPTSPIIPYY